MLSKLWKFLRGYVIIEVAGFSVERFINLAVHRGVAFSEIKTTNVEADEPEQTVERKRMIVSIGDFFKLKIPARKTKCKFKIVRRVGLPFFLHRYRKRKVLFLGTLFFIAMLYGLTSFVWRVDIEGNERLCGEDITAFLADNGLGFGSFKRGVDARHVERLLIAGFADINWVNIEIRGTVVTVRITETLPTPVVYDYTAPADIVAAKDALILGVAATSGVPQVRPGDVVSQGELLVSGTLIVGTADEIIRYEYVRAEAVITAKIIYEMEVHVPLEFVERNLSGKTRTFRGVELFGRQIGLRSYDIGFISFDKAENVRQLSIGASRPVPFVWRSITYSEIVIEPARRTEEEAQFYASELIAARLAAEFTEAEIIDVRIDFALLDGFVRARAMVTTIEDIGRAVAIEVQSEPMEE